MAQVERRIKTTGVGVGGWGLASNKPLASGVAEGAQEGVRGD